MKILDKKIINKKKIIENHIEFLNAMQSYDNLTSIKKDIWDDLYIKYGSQAPSKSYINKIVNEFIF